jgi:hypothetical protein
VEKVDGASAFCQARKTGAQPSIDNKAPRRVRFTSRWDVPRINSVPEFSNRIIEEHAQNGLGSKRAAQRTSEFPMLSRGAHPRPLRF